eukprot:s1703_g21.t1
MNKGKAISTRLTLWALDSLLFESASAHPTYLLGDIPTSRSPPCRAAERTYTIIKPCASICEQSWVTLPWLINASNLLRNPWFGCWSNRLRWITV